MLCRALQSYHLYRYHHEELSGCTLTSTSAALKIGTEGSGDFENVIVDNCIISGCESNHIEDVVFDRVQVTLRRKSKWERGLYDLRPGHDQGIEKITSPGFLMRRAAAVPA